MNFYKYEATGNDFVILNRPFEEKYSAKWIAKVCDRHYGIGADGLFFLWEKSGQWNWRFFNNDGSVAKFCGNASRCLLLWLHNQINQQTENWKWTDGQTDFSGSVLKIKGELQIEVTWAKSDLKILNLNSHHQNLVKPLYEIGLEKALWVSAGVPHLVLIGSSWPRKIRKLFYDNHLTHHPELIKESNISWLSRTDMSLVTFERGLEEESLACGSAALAAYYALKLRSQEDKNLKVPADIQFHFPGGDLNVKESESSLHLSGAARKVFEGYYEET